MVLKVSYNFRDFQGISWIEKERLSLLHNPSVVNGTMGIEVGKVLLFETNFSLNTFNTAKSSVFTLFSLSAIMKLLLFFCLPVSRFSLLKKRFDEFNKRVSRSSKYSCFFDGMSSMADVFSTADAISHFREISFVRLSAISLIDVKREISSDYAFLYIFVKPRFI